MVEDTQRAFPAIIDTGTSQIQVPQTVFAQIRQQWEKDFPRKITCSDEEAFCTTEESCETAAKSIKPIGLQLSSAVFTLQPKQYLWQVDGGQCYFILSECRLYGKDRDLYILGGAFLKHFYSAYDFDQNRLSLGINTHSEGLVSLEVPKS